MSSNPKFLVFHVFHIPTVIRVYKKCSSSNDYGKLAKNEYSQGGRDSED
jgi:hypothetical protein